MFWLIIFLYLIFSHPVLAAPTVTISNYPANIVIGDTFAVTFSVGNTAGISYHYKIISTAAADLVTEPNTACGGNYDQCGIIDVSTTAPSTATAYAKITTTTGSFDIKIRIAQSDTHSKTYDSQVVNINAIQPTATPTLTPSPTPTVTNTPVPTNTPLPTNTPSPTSTPTLTHTPTPTSTLTPTTRPSATPIPTVVIEEDPPMPELTPIIEPTPQTVSVGSTSSDDILGISDIIKPTPTGKLKNLSISPTGISVIFIVLGGLLLFVPVIIYKIKS